MATRRGFLQALTTLPFLAKLKPAAVAPLVTPPVVEAPISYANSAYAFSGLVAGDRIRRGDLVRATADGRVAVLRGADDFPIGVAMGPADLGDLVMVELRPWLDSGA